MSVAALYDVHGNLPALEAVLEEVRDAGVDRVLVGGDVLPGPMPAACLARLEALEIPVHYIRGNGESAVLAELAGEPLPPLPESVLEVIRWTARRIGPEAGRRIGRWPATLHREIDGIGRVLFCHATPGSDTEIFTRRAPEERLLALFGDTEAELAVCGHTHMPFDLQVGGLRIVNAGSVGMPYGEPGADWLLLGPDVQPRHTPYDLEAAARRIRATDYPGADDFAERSVLRPPTAESMLDALSGARG